MEDFGCCGRAPCGRCSYKREMVKREYEEGAKVKGVNGERDRVRGKGEKGKR
jgi:hypothetical protein